PGRPPGRGSGSSRRSRCAPLRRAHRTVRAVPRCPRRSRARPGAVSSAVTANAHLPAASPRHRVRPGWPARPPPRTPVGTATRRGSLVDLLTGCVDHGIDDVLVAGAAAEVTFDAFPHLLP